MTWLMEEAAIGPVSFTDELTRAIAWLIEQPYESGIGPAGRRGFPGSSGQARSAGLLPAISWIVVITAVDRAGAILPRTGGWPLLVGACFVYLAVFGQWDSAMVTLASVLIAVPIGAGGGLLLGHLGLSPSAGPRRSSRQSST